MQYLTQLQQLNSLGSQVVAAEPPLEQLHEYHAGKLAMGSKEASLTIALPSQPALTKRADQRIADFSKVAIIERPIEAVLAAEPDRHKSDHVSNTSSSISAIVTGVIMLTTCWY